MTTLTQNLIAEISGDTEPTLLRSRYVKQLVRAVNKNTLAIGPPRSAGSPVTDEIVRQQALGETGTETDVPVPADNFFSVERFIEASRKTSTVRVENPEDATQWVDVARIDEVLLVSLEGHIITLEFTNTSE